MKQILSTILLAMLFSACGSKIELVNLTVESQDGSQALATAQPRFSWQYETKQSNVMQTTYRIVVASTRENAEQGIGDLWDSGVIESSDMLYIPYEGKQLHSRDIAFWKVYATLTYGKNNKKATTESEVQQFEISLLSPDDWHAHWIGRDYEDD
ncbi:MAG: alpha-rhamnosidase, partial [Bacteroidales bacterium]|nr:alpha-rhamnosidase [Bacteroidales bacterium]